MQDLDPTKVYRHHVAISHTRWATHGPPSAVNSHPHVSDDAGEFVVVHNGIITNYQALKDILVGDSTGTELMCATAGLTGQQWQWQSVQSCCWLVQCCTGSSGVHAGHSSRCGMYAWNDSNDSWVRL